MFNDWFVLTYNLINCKNIQKNRIRNNTKMNAKILGECNSIHSYHVPFVFSVTGNLTLKADIFSHLIKQKIGNMCYRGY